MPAKKKIAYDTYYQTENLFGNPYPELISYFKSLPRKGKILDLGCGQGRDAISLARMDFEVVGVDHSKLGIEQMEKIAKDENLSLTGLVADIYQYDQFLGYDQHWLSYPNHAQPQ